MNTSKNFYLGREIKNQHDFTVGGTFQSLYSAQHFLRQNDYNYGSNCAHSPIAVVKSKQYNLPQKWKNFTQDDIDSIDGVLISADFREGTTTLILF